MRRLLAGLVAAAACLAAPASAQDYPAQVRTYLERGMAAHAGRGYQADPAHADTVFSLRMGEARLLPLSLDRGVNYRIYAACDADCSDLDMEIFGVDGAYIERDIALDATPFVQVTPSAAGRHYARVWLAACENEPCFVALRVVRGGQPEVRTDPVAAADGGQYAAGVRSLLEQLQTSAAREGYGDIPGAAAPEIAPLMLNSRGLSVTYSLQAGRAYRFVAACDSDCTDLDIEVADARGRVIGRNIAVDNPTSVDVTPGASGEYTVRTWLAACSVEPCYTGQRGMLRAGR